MPFSLSDTKIPKARVYATPRGIPLTEALEARTRPYPSVTSRKDAYEAYFSAVAGKRRNGTIGSDVAVAVDVSATSVASKFASLVLLHLDHIVQAQPRHSCSSSSIGGVDVS